MKNEVSDDKIIAELKALKASLAAASAELTETRYKLADAEDALEAIRSGEVDALVVKSDNGHQLYTLKSSDLAYRVFIEQMITGAVTLDENGNILYCNSRFADFVGVAMQKVTGQSICGFVDTAEEEECLTMVRNAWHQHGLKQEFHLLSPAGEKLPVLFSMQVLELQEGRFLSVIVTDLTEQKMHQQELEAKNIELLEAQNISRELNATLERTIIDRTRELYDNQEQLARILETMAEGVAITDKSGRLTYANPLAQRILGISEAAARTDAYLDPHWPILRVDGTHLSPEDHPMTLAMKKGNPVYDFEVAIQPPEKDRFYISINAAPIRDEQGNITGGVATFMDVTHRRKTMQQKDDFISVASHELRTPITTLKASIQLLSRVGREGDPAIFEKLISQSNKSLNKVSVLIKDLLNATKISEGQLELRKSRFLLKALIDDCCPHVRASGVYNIIYDGPADLQIEGDYDKLDQVVVNFVNNAVKYAPDSKEVFIKAAVENGFVKVSVVDKGPGIPPDKIGDLFQRYQRADHDGKNLSGLGLGLYISSQIIRRHGGSIGVNSTVGKGSSFWFTVPL